MQVLQPGALVGQDFDVLVTDSNGVLVVPYSIGYAVYRRDGDTLVLVTPTANEQPQSDYAGHYYPYWQVPEDAQEGIYRIIWSIQVEDGGPTDQIIQEFQIQTQPESPYPKRVQQLIRRLRIILRDNNPDRNYHFRPPAWTNQKDAVTQHFSYIWEDEELYTFLEMGLAAYNFAAPETTYTLESLPEPATYPVLILAAAMACAAVALNWVADEFDYSIGGKSLTIEKSSKYQAMKDSFDQQAQQVLEQKKLKRHMRGLVQRTRPVGIYGRAHAAQRISSKALQTAIAYVTPWL